MTELIKITENKTMSSRRIAELTGKQHAHVCRDVRKLDEHYKKTDRSKVGQIEYIDSKGRKQPEFLLTESQSLDLAMGYDLEIRIVIREQWEAYKTTLPEDQDDLILRLAKRNVEANRRMDTIEDKVKLIEAKSTTSDVHYFAIMGYANLSGKKIDLKEASLLGRKASKLCIEMGFSTYTVADPRFGTVKTYPKEVLETVFNLK